MGKFRFKKTNLKVNNVIRNFNKTIEKDDLWRGRFYLRQVKKRFSYYDDYSGVHFNYLYEIVDKKTGIGKKEWFGQYEILGFYGHGSWKLWCFVNDFIVKDIDVWGKENPRDPNFSKDYTRVPMLKKEQIKYIGVF